MGEDHKWAYNMFFCKRNVWKCVTHNNYVNTMGHDIQLLDFAGKSSVVHLNLKFWVKAVLASNSNYYPQALNDQFHSIGSLQLAANIGVN